MSIKGRKKIQALKQAINIKRDKIRANGKTYVIEPMVVPLWRRSGNATKVSGYGIYRSTRKGLKYVTFAWREAAGFITYPGAPIGHSTLKSLVQHIASKEK